MAYAAPAAQAQMNPLPALQRDKFAVDLFDCCAAPGCYVTWCGCCAFGDLTATMPPNSVCCAGQCGAACCGYASLQLLSGAVGGLPLWLLMHFQVRQNMRKLFGMPAYGFEDAVALCFCEGCAMCQELNEADLRRMAMQQAQLNPAFVVAAQPAAEPVMGVPPPAKMV